MLSLNFFLRKFLRYLLIIFTILLLNFSIPRLMPGDPIMYLLGEDAYFIVAPEELKELKRRYELDKPWTEQFVLYILRLLQGDLGYSFSFGRPVASIVIERLPITLLLTIPSTFLGVVIGAYLGTLAGWRPERASNRVLTISMLLLYSIPPYWLGMIFLLIFSLHLRLLPTGGAPSESDIATFLSHMILPCVTLTIFVTAYNTVIMRGVTAAISEEGFVLTALSKGLRKICFLNRHLLKPSLPPLIAISAIEFGFAFSGALLIEIVFSWPGIGLMMWEAVIARDYPLLQALFTLSALIVVLANTIADLLCIIIDPRLRNESL